MAMFIRAHKVLIKAKEIETVEWKNVSEEQAEDSEKKLYQVVFHMKSGKKFTRRVFENQLSQCLDIFEESG
jgi:hypothetical protein